MIPMTGLMMGSVYLIYWITEAGANAQTDRIVRGAQEYIDDPDLPWVFAYLLLIELVTFYMRKARIMGYQAKNMWRVIRRILYAQLYLIGALVLLAAFPKNIIAFAIFIIGFKIVLEYRLEDKKFYQKLADWIFRRNKTEKRRGIQLLYNTNSELGVQFRFTSCNANIQAISSITLDLIKHHHQNQKK